MQPPCLAASPMPWPARGLFAQHPEVPWGNRGTEGAASSACKVISPPRPECKAADQVYCPWRVDRKEAYKINKYLHMLLYSPHAPWEQTSQHACKSTLKHKLTQSLLTNRCVGKAQDLQCRAGPQPQPAGGTPAWSSQPSCPASAAHPQTTMLGHSVPGSSQSDLLSSCPFQSKMPSHAAHCGDSRTSVCALVAYWPRGMEANWHMLGCQLIPIV